MNNMSKYYNIPPNFINFIVKNEYELSMFNICINSLYDDILNLNLKVNIETTQELLDIINSLKMNEGVKLNVTLKNEEEGLTINNNCIVLPNTLSSLNKDNILEATPKVIQDILKEIEETCIVPKKIIIFNENNDLPKEQIPFIMNIVFSSILKAVDITETIHNDIKTKQNITIEEQN
jgi:hypothetical protein